MRQSFEPTTPYPTDRHHRARRRAAIIASGAALVTIAAGAIPAASAAPADAKNPWKVKPLVTDLSSPKALTLDGKGNPVVAQNAFGEPDTAGPIVKYFRTGPNKGETKSFGPDRSITAIAKSPAGGYWTLRTNAKLYWQRSLGKKPKEVRNLRAFAENNPDPYNQEGEATESNPFGLAVTDAGRAVVTDAAANTLLRVSREGKVRVLARFAPSEVSTDHIPPAEQPPGGLPPTIVAEAVPTGVAVTRGGDVLVGELRGYPFRPGTSRIWKVKSDVKNAVCSTNPDIELRRCESRAKGLTGIAAVAQISGGGVLALEYAKDGVLAFESGCFGPAGCPPAALIRIKNGSKTDVSGGTLSAPGSIVPFEGRTYFATDALFTPGGGRLVRIRR
jgi:hypothetical protein